MFIFGALLLVAFYPIAGIFVDKYGLGVMPVGSTGLAIAAWWFLLAGPSYYGALTSRILGNMAGALNASSLLRLTNNWFPEGERPMAVAIGSMVATIGSGCALLYGPIFTSGVDLVNFNLKSCLGGDLVQETGLTEEELAGQECASIGDDKAEELFCCVAETDIDALNLSIALIATAVAIYAIVVVRDAPVTPPSKAGTVRQGASVWESMKLLFARRNYNQICLADFFATGPVNLVFSTVDRIFPPSVSEYSTVAAAIGLFLAIPAAGFFARRLAKYSEFYELTAAGYTLAAVCFTVVALLMLIENEVTDVIILVTASVAIIFSVMWTVSVYELKIEYTFSPLYALQGYIVSTDRTIINFSSVAFLFAIPPERFNGKNLDGRQFSFLVSAFFVILGAILALTIKDKRSYLRQQYEKENRLSVANLMDYEEDVKKEDINAAKEKRVSRRMSSTKVEKEADEVVITSSEPVNAAAASANVDDVNDTEEVAEVEVTDFVTEKVEEDKGEEKKVEGKESDGKPDVEKLL